MRTLILLGLAVFASLAAAETPPQSGPLGVPPTAREIELGRKLFFDPRLSQDNTVACATCHDPNKGWSDGLPLAVGILGQTGTRHSPSIINSAYTPLVFWDGRTVTNVPQALLPLSNPVEMGRQSEADVLLKLRLIPGYVALFAETFGTQGFDTRTQSAVSGPNLARAIAAFESTVVSFDAPIDRYLEGDEKALSPDAKIGYRIFEAANCMQCHTPPLFTDNLFHNTGTEFAGKLRVTDLGRAGILPQRLRTADTIRAFKTPTLREINRTAPYMHAGNFDSLERVVQHYNLGGLNYLGQKDRNLSRRIVPLGLTDTQQKYLILFLKEGFSSPNYPLIEAPELP